MTSKKKRSAAKRRRHSRAKDAKLESPSPGADAPTKTAVEITSQREKPWTVASHALGIGPMTIMAPGVIMYTKGRRSAHVRRQAAEALNFQITGTIALLL